MFIVKEQNLPFLLGCIAKSQMSRQDGIAD